MERSSALERHVAALSCFGALPGFRSRYIPAAVRREVWRRDQGCCSYVDRHSGRRCGSRYRLEIDHIAPFALGGASELSNLRLRCKAHHKLRHAQRHSHPGSVPTDGWYAPVPATLLGICANELHDVEQIRTAYAQWMHRHPELIDDDL